MFNTKLHLATMTRGLDGSQWFRCDRRYHGDGLRIWRTKAHPRDGKNRENIALSNPRIWGIPNAECLVWDYVAISGLSTLNEGQNIEYEVVANRGKESAENIKVK